MAEKSEQSLDEIIAEVLRFVDENMKGNRYEDASLIPHVPAKYAAMLLDAGYLVGRINDKGCPEVICLSLKGRDRLRVFPLQIGEQSAQEHESVLACLASWQRLAERPEKSFQPTIRTGKTSLRNLRILFNFPFSRRKSRVHDNPLSPKTGFYNKTVKIGKINLRF